MIKTLQLICTALFISAASIQAATLTVIADYPSGWGRTTADLIRRYQSAHGHACDVFTVEITPGQAPVLTQNIWDISGQSPGDQSAVLVVDATLPLFPVQDVAAALAEFLLGTQPLPEIAPPASIHFIGHARGADLLFATANSLSMIRIDQFTTIDTPFAWDVPANVLFADNYFQTQALLKGVALPGAFNREMAFPVDTQAYARLRDWYATTIGNTLETDGYFFADCPYGSRNLDGFRSRRVGQPKIEMVFDPGTKTFIKRISAGSTGKYYWQWSVDLNVWFTSTDKALVLDGHAFEYPSPPLTPDLIAGKLFYRLTSVAASF